MNIHARSKAPFT